MIIKILVLMLFNVICCFKLEYGTVSCENFKPQLNGVVFTENEAN